MGMNIKAAKKMKGFMCHSPASTAVCMTQDYGSVIVPRSVQLGDTRAIPASTVRRSSRPVSSIKKDAENRPQKAKNSVEISDPQLVFQLVVLRVSLHCQGCAAKVKKHLSKMEGVTSFSVDLESKRVTVMGHVSPSGVLESISKVKKAEFWPNS